jgi:membrane protein implicated in regulation of membrane protease activity
MVWLWIWGIITSINLVIEFMLANLFTLWFSAGGMVTLVVVALVPNIALLWQFVIFISVSILLLVCVRTICIKVLNRNKKVANEQIK